MKWLIALLLVVYISGCGSLETQNLGREKFPEKTELIGVWYFHMGNNGHIKLDLKAYQDFDVSVIPCVGNNEIEKPSGFWEVDGRKFRLIWSDGKVKDQEIIDVSPTELRLTSDTGYELYSRKLGQCNS